MNDPMAVDLPSRQGPGRSRGLGRHYLLVMMTLIYSINYIDRTIINVLVQSIKADLGLSDGQIGMVSGFAFALLYATMGLPFAWLAERKSRVNLISIALAVWSGMTALCGLAHNFWHLFLARVGVGIGEAGCNPTAQSMISDIYPPERRATALSVYSMGVPIGTLLGALFGGWIGQTFRWRYAFVLVGLPGVLLAIIVRLTIKEPQRGGRDVRQTAADDSPSVRETLSVLWKSKAFRQITSGFTAAGIAGYSITGFLIAYILRQFDVTLIEVSFGFGVIYGIAGVVGMILGGSVADWAGRRDKRMYGFVPAAAHLITVPIMVIALLQTNLIVMTALMVIPATLFQVYIGSGYAMAHDLVSPRMRATATAVLLMISTLIGMGFGPPAIGMVSDMIAKASFVGDYAAACQGTVVAETCRAAQSHGLLLALIAATCLYLWAAIHFILAGFAFRREARSNHA